MIDLILGGLLAISTMGTGALLATLFWRNKLDEYHNQHQMDLLKLRSDLIKMRITKE